MHQRARRRLNSVDAFAYFFDLRECLRSLQCTAESPRRSKSATMAQGLFNQCSVFGANVLLHDVPSIQEIS